MSNELSGFSTLKPAINTKVDIKNMHDLGTIHTGSKLTHYGTTVPGFEPAFKANVNFEADWLSFDPDGNHARIDLKGMVRTEQGHAIDFRYTGVIKMPPEVWKIFNIDPDIATVLFGHATGSHTFLVTDTALKDLENSIGG